MLASKSPAIRIYSSQFCPNSTNEDFEMISLAFHACIILHPVSDTTCALTSLHHTGHAATMLLVEDFIALLPLCPPLYVRSLLSQQCTQQCLSNERQKASVETSIESNKRIQKGSSGCSLPFFCSLALMRPSMPPLQGLCSEAKPFCEVEISRVK